MKKFIMGSLVIALLAGLCVPVMAQKEESIESQFSRSPYAERLARTLKAKTLKANMINEDIPPCEVSEDAVFHNLAGILHYDQDYGGADSDVSAVYELKLARTIESQGNMPEWRVYVFAVQGASNLNPEMPNNGDTADMVSSRYGVALAESVTLWVFPKKDLSDKYKDRVLSLPEISQRYRVIENDDELALLILPKQGSEKTYIGNFSGEFFPKIKFCGPSKYLKLADISVVEE